MRQVVLERPGVVQVREADLPIRDSSQATVQLRLGGICGSDLAAYRGTSPLVTYPRVLGHELLVDVLDCPEQPELQGRRAVVNPMIPCGLCRACRVGRYNCCARLQVMGVHVDGGLQEAWTLPRHSLVLVPDLLSDEVAVLAEPLTIAYHAVQRSGIRAGGVAVIFGAGPIGLLISRLITRARGCRALVVDIDAHRMRVAESIGATALRGDAPNIVELVREATSGDLADVVFEASGNAGATLMTTAVVGHAGRIVLVGWNRGPVEMDTVAFMRKEIDLLGSRNSLDAFPAVLNLLAGGVIDPTFLVTNRFGLAESELALDLLDRGYGAVLKVLITPD